MPVLFAAVKLLARAAGVRVPSGIRTLKALTTYLRQPSLPLRRSLQQLRPPTIRDLFRRAIRTAGVGKLHRDTAISILRTIGHNVTWKEGRSIWADVNRELKAIGRLRGVPMDERIPDNAYAVWGVHQRDPYRYVSKVSYINRKTGESDIDYVTVVSTQPLTKNQITESIASMFVERYELQAGWQIDTEELEAAYIRE